MTPDDGLSGFTETWEPSLAREFRAYDRLLRAKCRRPPCAWDQTGVEPYWKELPRWLAGRKVNPPHEVSPELLGTVLWGQTALFYAVRLQDDLLDGALPHTPLVLAPLLFLTEAERAFSSIIDSNTPFWNHYRRALETTVAGIVRVAEMQRDRTARADALLEVYGSVDAVLSVGSLAVCECMRSAEGIPRVNEFVRELGKVLLALDDMEDIEEDLLDGRLNYPARILLGRRTVAETDVRLLAKTWRPVARGKDLDVIKTALLHCLSRAGRAIGPLGLPEGMDLIETTRVAVKALTVSPMSG
jgi:hypothetical protein